MPLVPLQAVDTACTNTECTEPAWSWDKVDGGAGAASPTFISPTGCRVTQTEFCKEGDQKMPQTAVTAGIYVGKGWLDAATRPTRQTIRVEGNAAGFEYLAAWLAEHVHRVGLEASCGYAVPVLDAPHRTYGFEVVGINPQRIRRFAEAKG